MGIPKPQEVTFHTCFHSQVSDSHALACHSHSHVLACQACFPQLETGVGFSHSNLPSIFSTGACGFPPAKITIECGLGIVQFGHSMHAGTDIFPQSKNNTILHMWM